MAGGRPIKNGVDYFPLDVVMDDKVELIEAEHGIIGFGVIVKLYQKIYADNYYIKWDKKSILVFSNRVNVDINSINAIINSCMEWEVFNHKMYKKHNILTSTGIQKRFFEIVKRRKVVEVCKDFLLIKLEVNAYKNLINVDSNSQRKGKERKGKTDTLLEYLILKTESENLKQYQNKIIEFYKYRQLKPKDKQYKTDTGINGLFRDAKNCSKKGFDINDCLDITMERGWLTPDVSYFKNNDFNNFNLNKGNKAKQVNLTDEELSA